MSRKLTVRIISSFLVFSILLSTVTFAGVVEGFQYGIYTFDKFLYNATLGISDSGFYAEGSTGFSILEWWRAFAYGDTSFYD